MEGTLMGWLELTIATPMKKNPTKVHEFLSEFLKDDENFEINKFSWNTDDETPMQWNATYWDDPPPSFAYLFEHLVEHLELDEYLIFEEKVAFSSRPRTLRTILVSGMGVFKADADASEYLMRLRGRLLDGTEEEEEEEDADDENFDT